MGKFLKLFFGCHARPDRSFFINGKQFPICARCTGQLIGIPLGFIICCKFVVLNFWWIVLIMMPLIIDGTIQHKTNYESNNFKRLITGILFGIALSTIFAHIHLLNMELARRLLTFIFKRPPPYY